MMVLGAVPQVPENYVNVKMIIEQLNLEAIEFTLSVDIKMRKFFYKSNNYLFCYRLYEIAMSNILLFQSLFVLVRALEG